MYYEDKALEKAVCKTNHRVCKTEYSKKNHVIIVRNTQGNFNFSRRTIPYEKKLLNDCKS